MLDTALLRRVSLFADLDDHQFDFVTLGQERTLEPGEVLALEGDPAGLFWVLLEGEIQCTKRVGDRQRPWTRFTPHAYFGHELILLNTPHLTTLRAFRPSRLLEFSTEGFWKMLELCPSITRELLVVTVQRTQDLSAASMQAQKLISLGTLTSGLSQELYQVAQTGRQAVEHLNEMFRWMQPLTTKLNAQTMSREQQQFLLTLQNDVLEGMTALPPETHPSAWEAQQREMITWLEARNIPHADHFARTLSLAGLDLAALESIAAALPPASLCSVLAWLKVTLKGLNLSNQVEQSTQHIAHLVQTAKEYAYLDQAPLQEMDIHDGLESTLVMMNHRLQSGITVVRDYDHAVPPICVYGSDLNQVWTHIIDNALDAMGSRGTLTLRTVQVEERVRVEVIDTGVGIPADVQPHVFEQFFTTKDLNKGTGLGLAIAHQVIVNQHQGQIRIYSAPGETCIQVDLPMDLTDMGDRPISRVA